MSKTIEQLVDEVCEVIKAVRTDMYAGNIHASYQAARINPEGEVYRTIEASRCYSEGEYYKRVPHNLTAWEWANAANWNGDDDDSPVDADGRWLGSEEPVSDDERKMIEAAIVEWAEAGNYTLAVNA